ncbi:MAG: cytidylate kinase-like family protein [Spirochaetaceae bacterium]|nr:cytidylate kinase-like family protein [Spirochaetaceae bacterium]
MKKIITISREFGAGGGEIGKRIAETLGYHYADKELIINAARATNASPQTLINMDEKAPVIFGFTQSLFDLYNAPLEERFYESQKNIIKQIAEAGNCVIVGRNANSILSEYDNTLHIFIHAADYWRLQRLKAEKMPDESESKIAEHIKSVDKARRKYCSYFTNKDFGNADNYDLCLCSSKLGIDQCVKIILDCCK